MPSEMRRRSSFDVEDHDLALVPDLNHPRRMDIAVGPIHFRHVHEPLDSLLDLDERAEVRDVGHPSRDPAALRVPLRDAHPRVLAELLQTERHAVAFTVVLEDLDLDLVADVDHLGGVADAAPGHVGDVQQAVDSAEIDERAVVV